MLHLGTVLWCLYEQYVRACVQIGLSALQGRANALDRDGVGTCDDQGAVPRIQGGAYLAHHLRKRNQRLVTQVAAPLREPLVLDLYGLRPRTLQHPHAALHVQGVAPSSIGVDDEGQGCALPDTGRDLRNLGQGCQTDVGASELRIGDGCAREICGLEPGVLRHRGRQRVVHPGRKEWFGPLQAQEQGVLGHPTIARRAAGLVNAARVLDGVDMGRTLFDKIWDRHVVVERTDGQALLAIDRHYVHEGSFHAFGMLDHAGRRVRRPDLTFAVADHYAPSTQRPGPVQDAELAGMMAQLRDNAGRHGVALLDLEDPAQGIVHVAMPEQGLTLPGLTIVCGDSHTSTHGAFGALAFGIGASEVSHVLATQALWQRRPRTMRISVTGTLTRHVTAKDLILAVIARIGAAGAIGHVIEYAGDAVASLSMEARMTVCNMSIEAGGRAGLVAPDDTTFAWLHGRKQAPRGAAWDSAVMGWRGLRSDEGSLYDRDVILDGTTVAPTVTWGTSPETALPIGAHVPDPACEPDAARRDTMVSQLRYMGLAPGTALDGIAVDQVFIGSCTNGRLEDLRAAALVLRGRRALVPGLVVPGSTAVKRAAEAEGIDQVFTSAGLRWGEAGCSMCVGMNGDLVAAGRRCASTSNRNFEGRQGQGSRTHLMSPAMAAAAAVTGHITDVRRLV